jgi:flagellar basal-body rod modification protein FlgD
MSAINSLLGNSASSASSSNSNSSASGLGSLTASNFVSFLITELQNQDPLNPTDTSQMLGELSQIGQMQSATDLQTSLTGMVQQNQVTAASSMIGKSVLGTDSTGAAISGTVTSVQVSSNAVNLGLDSGVSLPISSITSITDPTTTKSSTNSSPTTGS